MSLDVYLEGPASEEECVCGGCGHVHLVTRKERYYDSNITHNLYVMAKEAGIYSALWEPEEIGVKTARDLIPHLEEGLKKLEANPDHYQKFNSPNGWGMYEHFVPFVAAYLDACINYPDADVRVSR